MYINTRVLCVDTCFSFGRGLFLELPAVGYTWGRVYVTVQVRTPEGLRGVCSACLKAQHLFFFTGIAFHDAEAPGYRKLTTSAVLFHFLLHNTAPPASHSLYFGGFSDLVNPSVRLSAALSPTARFDTVCGNRKNYGAVRCVFRYLLTFSAERCDFTSYDAVRCG